jgi:hypothetical protein
MVRKMFQLFEERQYLVGHMFYTADLHEWDFFCFDQPDVEQQKRNHWKKGSHVHFLNWRHRRHGADRGTANKHDHFHVWATGEFGRLAPAVLAWRLLRRLPVGQLGLKLLSRFHGRKAYTTAA